MIRTWGNSATRRFAETGKSKFSGMDADKADALLTALHNAGSLEDLSPLKSFNLHKLKADRKGQWAMTINGPWRLVFRFSEGHAWDVEVVDYH
ncbi:type II toxin-antitoxin system RelE/ParE family toxin [Nitratireductor soli]|uniref:type II toxin-antitoxin system RelE/ParE family toxin n=1 Tax=Nitratireductor soli TaxID=1670619 RepID=UPI00065DD652|nr:type II toxin-antitoxin system RelE/ParE family toxin [Nitratireductor soli]